MTNQLLILALFQFHFEWGQNVQWLEDRFYSSILHRIMFRFSFVRFSSHPFRVKRCRTLAYVLASPNWSIKTLNLLEAPNSSDVITIDALDKLAKLACIDLNPIKSNADEEAILTIKQSICKDVNVILKCAKSLKVSYLHSLFIYLRSILALSFDIYIILEMSN